MWRHQPLRNSTALTGCGGTSLTRNSTALTGCGGTSLTRNSTALTGCRLTSLMRFNSSYRVWRHKLDKRFNSPKSNGLWFKNKPSLATTVFQCYCIIPIQIYKQNSVAVWWSVNIFIVFFLKIYRTYGQHSITLLLSQYLMCVWAMFHHPAIVTVSNMCVGNTPSSWYCHSI